LLGASFSLIWIEISNKEIPGAFWRGLHSEQPSKPKIDKEVDAENKTSEPRPAQGQNQMVGISPIELLGIELNKFELT
jgi:hypothetical protein